MKNGGARVAQNEFSPTGVSNGVDLFEGGRNVSTPGGLGWMGGSNDVSVYRQVSEPCSRQFKAS
jgi:hypothetical protein